MENYDEDETESWTLNISANNPAGNLLRAHIMTGWAVLWRLRDIARKVSLENISAEILPIKQLEEKILTERQKYIKSLSYRERYGFDLMNDYSSSAFTDRVFDINSKAGDLRTGNRVADGESWLNWLILREGPWFFAKAWATKEGKDACMDLIRKEWRKRTPKQAEVEISAACAIQIAFSNGHPIRVADPGGDSVDHGTNIGRTGTKKIEKVFKDVFFHLGRRLPADVINRMEREYSDYES